MCGLITNQPPTCSSQRDADLIWFPLSVFDPPSTEGWDPCFKRLCATYIVPLKSFCSTWERGDTWRVTFSDFQRFQPTFAVSCRSLVLRLSSVFFLSIKENISRRLRLALAPTMQYSVSSISTHLSNLARRHWPREDGETCDLQEEEKVKATIFHYQWTRSWATQVSSAPSHCSR